jgi:hypothetical protein
VPADCNPLSALVDASRTIQELDQRLHWSALAIKAAIELLHKQEQELTALRLRNIQLIDELRGVRKRAA